MAINITDSGASIKVEITAAYSLNGKTLPAQILYLEKEELQIKSQDDIIVLYNGLYNEGNALRFLYSDITSPAGATADLKAAAIEAFKDSTPAPTGLATSANQTLQITQETAINTVLGTKADAVAPDGDYGSYSFMSFFKRLLSNSSNYFSGIIANMTDYIGDLWGNAEGAVAIDKEIECESGCKIGSIVVHTDGDYNGTTGTIQLYGSTDNSDYIPVYQDDNVTPMILTLNGPLDIRSFVLKAVAYKWYRVAYLPGDTTTGTLYVKYSFKK